MEAALTPDGRGNHKAHKGHKEDLWTSSEKGLWLHAWASRLPNGEAGRRRIFELPPEDSKKHGVRGGR